MSAPKPDFPKPEIQPPVTVPDNPPAAPPEIKPEKDPATAPYPPEINRPAPGIEIRPPGASGF